MRVDTLPSTILPSAPRQAATSGPDDPRVIRALEEYLALIEAGECPDRSEFVSLHPEVARELADCLEGLEFVQAAVSQLHPAAATPAAEVAPFAAPQLGDYRIVREIGRGGMGVVYEAEQISLGRRVALKVLPFAAALDPKHLQRFKNEAQAAAHLHHQNIVPVYAVGFERGVHYYAMQFIEGRTLAEIIREMRALAAPMADAETRRRGDTAKESVAASPRRRVAASHSASRFRAVAGWGVQAAEALEYAHQVGVIHRDIKPANLMLDQRGNLWITDFGLARFQTDAGLTLSGDLMGTLRYMSPEQALGKRSQIDERTDVYSLGLTLYELLTLAPAFDGDSREVLLRQTTQEEPLPPRRINPAIPVELETIVLKAIAKSPFERYATAQELADDLRRFLEDKPIKARRPTLLEHAKKWARRHRRLVTASAIFVALAAVGLGIGCFLLWKEEAKTKARFWLAYRTVDEMYSQVAERWLDRQPHLEKMQFDFLHKALSYEEFAAEIEAEPQLLPETGKAYRRMGDMRAKLGQHAAAEQSYSKAIEYLTRSADAARDESSRKELALTHNNRGNLLRQCGRFEEAESAYRSALVQFEAFGKAFPGEPRYELEAAGCRNNLGTVLMILQRPEDAERLQRQAVSVLERLAKADAKSSTYRHDLAGAVSNLGNLLRDSGRPDDADEAYRRAVELWSQLIEELPAVPTFRHGLAIVRHQRSILLGASGKQDEARLSYREALTLREKLALDFPAVAVYRHELADTFASLAGLLILDGKTQEADATLAQALSSRRKLVQDFPESASYRLELARALVKQGQLLANDPPRAERAYRESLSLFQGLAQDFTNVAYYRSELAATHARVGDMLRAAGRSKEATENLRQAQELYEGLVKEFPEVAAYRRDLAALLKKAD